MKKFLITLLLIPLGIAAIYFYFGLRAHKYYESFSKTMEGMGYKVEKLEITTGVFSSEAQITLVPAPYDDPPFSIISTDVIYHGPFPLKNILEGQFPPKFILAHIKSEIRIKPSGAYVMFLGFLNQMPPIYETSELHFDGSSSGTINQGKVKFQLFPEMSVVWKGMEGEFRFSPGLEEIDFSFESPGIGIEIQDANLNINSLNLKYEMYKLLEEYYLYIGNQSIEIEDIEFDSTIPEFTHIVISKIKMMYEMKLHDSNLILKSNYEFEEFEIEKKVYGPAVVEQSLFNIDILTLAKMLKHIRELSNDSFLKIEDPEKVLKDMFTPYLKDFVRKSPGFEISKMRLQTPEGEIAGWLKLKIKGDKELPPVPIMIFQALEGSAHFEAPEKLFRAFAKRLFEYKAIENIEPNKHMTGEELDKLASEAVDDHLRYMVGENIIVIKKGIVQSDLTLSDGHLKLNAREIPLPLDYY